ncbi:hypothetical protein GQ457_08G017250 [Hibiscus cannabinus]
MVETSPPTTTLPLEEPQEIPSGWSTQKTLLENRLNLLEASTEENKDYLQRIIKLMTKEAEDLQDASPTPTPHTQAKARAIAAGKQPLQVTVINEHEKYSFHPIEPGLLAQKPPATKQPFPELHRVESLQDKRGEYSMSKESDSTHNTYMPKPKIELQFFTRDNPKSWVRGCEKYFTIFSIPKNHKLELATMFLQGKTEVWFDGYMMQKHRATWHEFVADLCHHFADKEFNDVIEEFNKMFQQTTVDDYQTKFEELKPFMLQHNSHLEEAYFVSSFISGLKDEIKHKAKVHEPTSLTNAYRKARLYELALEVEGHKLKSSYRYSSSNSTVSLPKQQLQPASPPFKQPPNTLKQTLLEYRRTNNLCFKCGEKFGPAHQCKPKKLIFMEEEEMDQDSDQELHV